MVTSDSRLKLQTSRGERLRFERLEDRWLLAADWQNPVDPVNVDGVDGIGATPVDALLVVNELSRPSVSDPLTFRLPELGPEEGSPPPFLDVDGDHMVSPLDALLVINALFETSSLEPTDTHTHRAPDSVVAGTPAALAVGVGYDTLVNTTTGGAQSFPDVASFADGSYVIVWTSNGQDGSSTGIYGQRYDASGLKLGEEFRVNAETRRSQQQASVAAGADGQFVVAWQSLAQDGSGWGVYGQIFDSAGNIVGNEFLVNETTRGNQYLPDVTYLSGGDIVFAWEGRGAADSRGIYMRRFGADGSPAMDELAVNEFRAGPQNQPSIVGTLDDKFVVAWDGRGPNDNAGLFLRYFDGSAASSQMQVGDSRSSRQMNASVASGASGQFLVTWDERPDAPGSVGTGAQIFTGDLTMVGQAFRPNQTTEGSQLGTAADFLDDGSLVIGWAGSGPGDQNGVFTRMFAADGMPLTDERLTNETTDARQVRPTVAASAHGYVTVWAGFGDSDTSGIYARFAPLGSDDPSDDFTISGTVFIDANGNGGKDSGEQDTRAEGATISLRDNDGNLVDSAQAAANGSYTFSAPRGTYTVSVSAAGVVTADPDGTRDGETPVTLNADVQNIDFGYNRAPVAEALACDTATEGQAFSCDISPFFSDPDGSVLTYAESALPAWLSFDQISGEFSGTPSAQDVGESNLTVTATDPGGLNTAGSFMLKVVPVPLNVSGVVFADADSSGQRDNGEAGIADVTVYMRDHNNRIVDATRTNADGNYQFEAFEGNYSIWVTAPGVRTADPDEVIDNHTEITLDGDLTGIDFGYNRLPVASPITNRTNFSGVFFEYDISPFFTDLDGPNLTYEVTSPLPSWLTFDEEQGVLSGLPSAENVGSLNVVVAAHDPGGLRTSSDFTLSVTEPPPQFSISGTVFGDADGSGERDAGEPGIDDVAVTLRDSTGEMISSVQTDANGGFSFTALLEGEYTVLVNASGRQTADPDATLDDTTVITLNADTSGVDFGYNRAPDGSQVTCPSAIAGTPFTCDVSAFFNDPDGSELTYAASGLPAWLGIDPTTGVLSGMPAAADIGSESITVTAIDAGGEMRTSRFDLLVQTDQGQPPVIDMIGAQEATVDCSFTLPIQAMDPEGGPLTYSIMDAFGGQLPDWLTIDESTGVLSGIPEFGQFNVFVAVTDTGGQSANQTFTLTVNPNRPPMLFEIPDLPFLPGTPVIIEPVAEDPDGACDTLTFSATANGAALPNWLSIDPATGVLSGQVPASTFPPIVIELSVSDGINDPDSQTFRLCLGVVCPPAVTILPPASYVGSMAILESLARNAPNPSSDITPPVLDMLGPRIDAAWHQWSNHRLREFEDGEFYGMRQATSYLNELVHMDGENRVRHVESAFASWNGDGCQGRPDYPRIFIAT